MGECKRIDDCPFGELWAYTVKLEGEVQLSVLRVFSGHGSASAVTFELWLCREGDGSGSEFGVSYGRAASTDEPKDALRGPRPAGASWSVSRA